MNVALFTDTRMLLDQRGMPYPCRDQFVKFIAPLGRLVGGLTIASPCGRRGIAPASAEFLPVGESLRFVELPFYHGAEDCYRHVIAVLARARPKVRAVISHSEIVLLRLPNCLAPLVAHEARREEKPLVLYWAGPPVLESARRNYPGTSMRHRAARAVATVQQKWYRRLARTAALHVFIDPHEHVLMGRPTPVCWLVPNLVREADVAAAPRPRRARVLKVVFAGRVTRHKGVFDLLRAVEHLRSRNVDCELVILGDGPQLEEAQRECERRGLAPTVRFTGHVDQRTVKANLSASDVFALPSYAESVPKVLWEAWASGLAVITTPVGAVMRHVRDGVEGLLVPPGDARGLAAAIERLALDEGFRMQLATAGLLAAREHSWDGELARLADALCAVNAPVLPQAAVHGDRRSSR